MADPTPTVHLFGTPQIYWNERPLCLERRQVRALFYYLAARLQPVARARLCNLLWSDQSENVARRNLSHLLTHLRHCLPDPSILLIYHDQIGLDAARVVCDTAQLQHLQTDGGESPSPEQVRAALALYTGPFLDGFSLPHQPEFEDWLEQERQTWEALYLTLLRKMIDLCVQIQAHEEAISYARQYLAVDDLAEQVHGRLIDLYEQTGDHHAAQQQYEQCQAILQRELGVEPLPYQYPPGWSERPFPFAQPSPIQPDTERGQVAQKAYRQVVTSGQGQVALIATNGDEALRLFLTTIPQTATVLYGSGQPGEKGLAYAPLVELLQPVVQMTAILDRISPIWLTEAARLWPELRTDLRHRPLPPPIFDDDPLTAKTRLCAALYQLVATLCAVKPPVILYLQNVHWLDAPSREWLIYLAHRIRPLPLLLLGSYHPAFAHTVADLRYCLQPTG